MSSQERLDREIQQLKEIAAYDSIPRTIVSKADELYVILDVGAWEEVMVGGSHPVYRSLDTAKLYCPGNSRIYRVLSDATAYTVRWERPDSQISVLKVDDQRSAKVVLVEEEQQLEPGVAYTHYAMVRGAPEKVYAENGQIFFATIESMRNYFGETVDAYELSARSPLHEVVYNDYVGGMGRLVMKGHAHYVEVKRVG